MKTRNVAADAAKAIRAAYPLPEDLDRIANLATYDLHHGPVAAVLDDADDDDDWKGWPGFTAACRMLREWADATLPETIYFDAFCDGLSESAPEPWRDDETGEWIEPCTEETYELGRREILAAVFPHHLFEYL